MAEKVFSAPIIDNSNSAFAIGENHNYIYKCEFYINESARDLDPTKTEIFIIPYIDGVAQNAVAAILEETSEYDINEYSKKYSYSHTFENTIEINSIHTIAIAVRYAKQDLNGNLLDKDNNIVDKPIYNSIKSNIINI